MRKLKITQGEAKIFNESFINEYGFYTQPISISTRSGILLSNAYGENKAEAIANAQLIADAFNTSNKCDMLPSELLEQRNELLGMLQNIFEDRQNETQIIHKWNIKKLIDKINSK